MVPPEDLPSDVQRFILQSIDSVPHLEALLLVWRQPGPSWTEKSLAHWLYVDASTARAIVQDLLQAGWIKRPADNPDVFGFDPSWDPAGAFMRQLATTYRDQLVRVATLIHSKPPAALRQFAKAFELKRD
jgi:hypothetical protein